MLSGKKTYIIGVVIIAYGIVLCIQGNTEQGFARITEGLGFIFLRAGVAKVGNP